MSRYSILSLVAFICFCILFIVMKSGISLSGFGSAILLLLFVVPLIGVYTGYKSKQRLLRWLLIGIHLILLCMMSYLLLLAYGISEL
ncbi:hypothetical protein OVA29_12325 [Exiguobacterium sp. SL14]|nr:hypothetical protein [Exiguobacterium sp. SL14]MCY1691377.1 hypothetical protein [Exiguobacterium sp. SL14]